MSKEPCPHCEDLRERLAKAVKAWEFLSKRLEEAEGWLSELVKYIPCRYRNIESYLINNCNCSSCEEYRKIIAFIDTTTPQPVFNVEPLGKEFEEVLYDNLDSLLVKDSPDNPDMVMVRREDLEKAYIKIFGMLSDCKRRLASLDDPPQSRLEGKP